MLSLSCDLPSGTAELDSSLQAAAALGLVRHFLSQQPDLEWQKNRKIPREQTPKLRHEEGENFKKTTTVVFKFHVF